MTDFERLKSIYVKTEKAEELYIKLKEIWDNDHFVLGILIDLNTDEDRQKILDAIENGMVDTDEISMQAFKLDEEYVRKWLKEEVKTKLQKEISEKLRDINDYDFFVYGVLSRVKEEEKQEQLLKALAKGFKNPNDVDDYVRFLNSGDFQ